HVESARPERDASSHGQGDTGWSDVRTNTELQPARRSQADHPARARQRHALLETAEQKHELVHRCEATGLAVELSFELPAELGDSGSDNDVAFRCQLVH